MATVTNAFRTWRTLKIGAGGWLTGFDQHTDGTLVCRTDTHGAYLYNTTSGEWEQLVTEASMPSADTVLGSTGGGVYEICIAPSNSQRFWMALRGYVYKSDNRGTTWTRTALTQVVNMQSNGTDNRIYDLKMAVDPLDEDIVYLGTMDIGLLRTLDGGDNWETLTDVPVGSGTTGENEPGVIGIIFDPTSAAISGRTATLWASSRGDGYYVSTDGGDSWTRPTGGPSTFVRGASFASNGTLWCSEGTGDHLWRYPSGGPWAEITASATSQSLSNILCDPFDVDRVLLATVAGTLQESLNANAATPTFSSLDFSGPTYSSSSDIPWLETAVGAAPSQNLSVGRMAFHPTTQNKIMCSMGLGFATTSVAPGINGSSPVPWVSMSKGVEQIVANECVALPDGRLFLASWDRPIFEITDPEVYPSSYIYKDAKFNNCGVIEYVRADPDIMAAGMYYSDSCFTTDGWETITEVSKPTGSAFSTNGGKGELVPFSATKFVWTQNSAQGIWFTDDAGQTWTRISLTGVNEDETSAGWLGLGSAYYLRRRCIAPDGLIDGMGYIWHDTAGVYKTTNHGEDWTRVFTGQLTANANTNKKIRCTPGVEGHLWATIGGQSYTGTGAFKRSEDGGANWSTIADVTEVIDFGFGGTAAGASYPRLWIIGYINGTASSNYSVYYSDDEGVSWTRVLDGAFPFGSLDTMQAIDGDKLNVNKAYIGFGGSGYAYTEGRHAGEPEGYRRFLLNNS